MNGNSVDGCSEDVAGWLLDPISDSLLNLVEEMKVIGLTEKGIMAICVLSAINPRIKACPVNDAPFIDFMKDVSDQLSLALEENDKGFPKSRTHCAIGFWVSIETLVEDIFVNYLIKHPSTIEKLHERFKDIRFKQNANFSQFGNYKRLFRAVENAVDDENVVRRYQSILDVLELSPILTDCQIDILTELCAMRNIVLHRRGVVDSEFVRKCPHSILKVGDKYTIDKDMTLSFYGSCSAFISSILRKAVVLLRNRK